jgi:hypothetical protein
VPANQILGLAPGEVFVHRNIANVISHSDLNALSVLQFAVDVLKVRHVTVVGHYGCGGVKVALKRERVGLADNWLRHVQDVADKHAGYLGTVLREDDAHTRLCELNVIEQVNNVCQTTVLQDAWARGQPSRCMAGSTACPTACCATSAWPPATMTNCTRRLQPRCASTAIRHKHRFADFNPRSSTPASGDRHAEGPSRYRFRGAYPDGCVPE